MKIPLYRWGCCGKERWGNLPKLHDWWVESAWLQNWSCLLSGHYSPLPQSSRKQPQEEGCPHPPNILIKMVLKAPRLSTTRLSEHGSQRDKVTSLGLKNLLWFQTSLAWPTIDVLWAYSSYFNGLRLENGYVGPFLGHYLLLYPFAESSRIWPCHLHQPLSYLI